MYDAPYTIQVLTDAQAAAAGETARNSSQCTRTSGGNFGAQYVTPAGSGSWTNVASGAGTVQLQDSKFQAPVTARYVRVFTNEPSTAHRYGTAIYELQLLGHKSP